MEKEAKPGGEKAISIEKEKEKEGDYGEKMKRES